MQLTLRAEQVALVEQVALAATLLPDQAELVVQAESAAAPVLAELVEMFLLFLRPIAEAAGYSYLFRPWKVSYLRRYPSLQPLVNLLELFLCLLLWLQQN